MTDLFCTTLPSQRKSWDATAIRCFQDCPRKYQLSMVEGWRSNGFAVDLDFGKIYHECVEGFDLLLAKGETKEEATDQAMRKALELTWVSSGDGPAKPWGGSYCPVWRCSNWIPKKRPVYTCAAAKGWWAGSPDRCPYCGEKVALRDAWVPDNKFKNRYTLIRTVLRYCDEQPAEGGVKPIVFPNGKVALELSFTMELPWVSPDGDGYILCGHLDSMVEIAGENAVRERKTTKMGVSPAFFDQYNPDIQIDVYDLAQNMMFQETLHPKYVMVEVTQVGVGFSAKPQRGLISITEGRREENLRDIGYWIKQAEACAQEGYFPKNTASCNKMNGCQFRRVCREEPGYSRDRTLEVGFHKDLWNPLDVR